MWKRLVLIVVAGLAVSCGPDSSRSPTVPAETLEPSSRASDPGQDVLKAERRIETH